jgi:hypothetical protein
MSNRKETPDVLGEILSATPATTAPASIPAKPAFKPKPVRKRPSGDAKPAARRNARSSRWEYMSVRFRDYRGWRPRFVDERELPAWKEGPEILEYLNTLGAEGWEMVGIVSRGRAERDAYFKRLKG